MELQPPTEDVEDARVAVVEEVVKATVEEMQKPSILQMAEEAINGPRNDAYGDPRPNHERIALFWSNYLGVHITWKQVVVMMVLLKVARLMQTVDHEDSWQDIAGYAGLLDLQKQLDKDFKD